MEEQSKIKSAEEILTDNKIFAGFKSSYTYDSMVKSIHDYHAQFKPLSVPIQQDKILLDALNQIAYPLKHLQESLQEGEQLNGQMAMQICNDHNYLKEIAQKAIEKYKLSLSVPVLPENKNAEEILERHVVAKGYMRYNYNIFDEKNLVKILAAMEEYKNQGQAVLPIREEEKVFKIIKQGEKVCDCPACGEAIIWGLGENTLQLMQKVFDKSLNKREEDIGKETIQSYLNKKELIKDIEGSISIQIGELVDLIFEIVSIIR